MFEVQLEKLQVEFKESLRESYEPLQAQIDGLVARVEQVRHDTDRRGSRRIRASARRQDYGASGKRRARVGFIAAAGVRAEGVEVGWEGDLCLPLLTASISRSPD
jgi:hypothetical protein